MYHGFGLGNSNTLYLPLLVMIFILNYTNKGEKIKFVTNIKTTEIMKNWKLVLSVLLLSLIIIAFISINIHGELSGSQLRFK